MFWLVIDNETLIEWLNTVKCETESMLVTMCGLWAVNSASVLLPSDMV